MLLIIFLHWKSKQIQWFLAYNVSPGCTLVNPPARNKIGRSTICSFRVFSFWRFVCCFTFFFSLPCGSASKGPSVAMVCDTFCARISFVIVITVFLGRAVLDSTKVCHRFVTLRATRASTPGWNIPHLPAKFNCEAFSYSYSYDALCARKKFAFYVLNFYNFVFRAFMHVRSGLCSDTYMGIASITIIFSVFLYPFQGNFRRVWIPICCDTNLLRKSLKKNSSQTLISKILTNVNQNMLYHCLLLWSKSLVILFYC